MNTAAIRSALNDAQREYDDLEAQRRQIDDDLGALAALITGYKAFLRHAAGDDEDDELPLPAHGPKGTISVRDATIEVMRTHPGRRMHVNEILDKARALGARTDARAPANMIDKNLVLLMNGPMPAIERLGGRVWRLKLTEDAEMQARLALRGSDPARRILGAHDAYIEGLGDKPPLPRALPV